MKRRAFHLTLVELDEEERKIISAVSSALGRAGARRRRTTSEVIRLIIRHHWKCLNTNATKDKTPALSDR